MSNPYELAARSQKAARLVAVIAKAGISASDLARCPASAEVWKAAAREAEVKPPSEKTCALVVHLLRGRERCADPFERFGEVA
jgi:hypothetical protein